MNKKSFLILILCLLFIFSCKNNNTNPDNTEPPPTKTDFEEKIESYQKDFSFGSTNEFIEDLSINNQTSFVKDTAIGHHYIGYDGKSLYTGTADSKYYVKTIYLAEEVTWNGVKYIVKKEIPFNIEDIKTFLSSTEPEKVTVNDLTKVYENANDFIYCISYPKNSEVKRYAVLAFRGISAYFGLIPSEA
ncbi:hypothetical protein Bint_2842 [Brachyspira intermedia PWS/A]|uniref:Lipoprotein n=1 Tax=Brachyspira intermedia (strain ATCC 51140 / PWS/A) TaxID=1045858 RepID=G0EI81_BRAIP|nr:hypothetical protein [Brachyspira intermedia]AEM23436.1 hypothetical protein Bint_2842 [Brachyspira intermedia PWS/A]